MSEHQHPSHPPVGDPKVASAGFVAEDAITGVRRSGRREPPRPSGDGGEPTRGTLVDGSFELRQVLGEGSKGRVYEAFDTRLERVVALKLARSLQPEGQRSLLRDEARALARVRHPSLPLAYQAGVWAGRDFVVEELIAGVPLSSYLGARRQSGLRFGVGEALSLIACLAEGLAALHAAGFVHANLTADNVLLTPERRAVMTGLTPPSPSRPRPARAPFGRSSVCLSPEVLLGVAEPSGAPSADVYALGSLGFELIAGQRPFASSSLGEELERRVREPAPPVSYFRREVPPAIGALFVDLLDAQPSRRPTAEHVVAWIKELEGAVGATRIRPPSVLIVDPDPESADTLRLCAEWAVEGADVVVGATGEWALSAMASRSPDLVLFDVRLPDMSGLELCMMARGNGLTDRCSLVAVGEGVSDHDIALLRKLGVTEFVPKGTGLVTSLPRLVKTLLDERTQPPSAPSVSERA